MSKTIEVSDEAYEVLRKRAEAAGVTPSELLLRELTVEPEKLPWDVMLKRIQSRERVFLTNEEIVSAIHEGREERDLELDDRH